MSEINDLLEQLLVEAKRTARDITMIKNLVVEAVNDLRGAEKEIPEYMRRFMNYMHDLHDIRYMYEETGLTPPAHILREQERCDDRLRQLLKDLHSDGNAFEKIRREMAQDADNRWDHTRQLEFKRSEQ